jgi:hypothetical protein
MAIAKFRCKIWQRAGDFVETQQPIRNACLFRQVGASKENSPTPSSSDLLKSTAPAPPTAAQDAKPTVRETPTRADTLFASGVMHIG